MGTDQTPAHYLVDEHYPQGASNGHPADGPSNEECKERFLDFYCNTPQARGLLSRYWNGFGFVTKQAQHDWAIWSAAWGSALRTSKACKQDEQCSPVG